MGLIRFRAVKQTRNMFEYIGVKMETREDPFNPDQEQYRNTLRVVVAVRVRDIQTMQDFDNSLLTFSEISGYVNGSNAEIRIKPGGGFEDFYVMNQEFTPISADGSEMVLHRYELVAVATEWIDINWDADE